MYLYSMYCMCIHLYCECPFYTFSTLVCTYVCIHTYVCITVQLYIVPHCVHAYMNHVLWYSPYCTGSIECNHTEEIPHF